MTVDGITVCPVKCWPCMLGQHEGGEHNIHDERTVHRLGVAPVMVPSAPCGCHCVTDPAYVPASFEDEPPNELALTDNPCPLCGEVGACGWDAEGRPLIHAISEDDDA